MAVITSKILPTHITKRLSTDQGLFENLKVLDAVHMSQLDVDFVYRPDHPSGCIMASVKPSGPIPPLVILSSGEPDHLDEMLQFIPKNEPLLWFIPTEQLRQVLEQHVNLTGCTENLVYALSTDRVAPTSGPSGARQLTADDISLMEAHRPMIARFLTKADTRVGVFGVIEDGQWVADATAVPAQGREYWSITNVYTREDQRGKGYAAQVVHRCLDYVRDQGGQLAVYECDGRNIPSQRTAEALGFELKCVQHECEGVLRT